MSRVQLESKKYNNIESFEKEFGHSYPTCRLHVKDSFQKNWKINQQNCVCVLMMDLECALAHYCNERELNL
jgi:hypothetical protein